MLLSIIIPAYNEEKTIQPIIQQCLTVRLPASVSREIIVINDGSTDQTKDRIATLTSLFPEIHFSSHIHRQGKGAALRTGFTAAQGDIIIIQDADLEYDPEDIPRIIQPLIANQADVVYGSRILGELTYGICNKSYWRYYWGGRLLSFLTNVLYNTHITDESTGYKAFKRSILSEINLVCRGFEFCPEFTAKILKKKFRLMEVPIICHPRSMQEGKKIRWHDGIIAIWTLIKHRW